MARKVDVSGIKISDVASIFSALNGGAISAACLRLDATVNDKKKKYIDKLGALMSVLENVLTDYISQTTPEQMLLLYEFLHRNTLNLVLNGDWGKHNAAKLHMNVVFTRFEEVAKKRKIPFIRDKIKTLLDLFPDPWGNPTLTKIMNNEPFSEEEALNFIRVEMGVVLIVRLEIMAEARLDVQALRLIEVCLNVTSQPQNLVYFENCSEEIVYMRDIYLILLVRTKNSAKVFKEVGDMGLKKTLDLVRRCGKGDRMVRLKKSRIRMAEFVANIALIIAMMHPVTEENTLFDLMEEWITLFTDTQSVFRLLGNMARHAVSSQHIYLLGLLLVRKFGEAEKSHCIELYIRALTVNLNEVQKHKSNSDQEKLKESEVQLSNGFLLLADFLKEDIITCRECVLTAFSLNPTSVCYNKIRNLAIESGKLCLQVENGPEENCENNQSSINCDKRTYENQDPDLKIDTGQPTGPEQLNGPLLGLQGLGETKEKQSTIDGTNISESDNGKIQQSKYNFLASPIHISDAQKIGIPQTLFDDLATVISSARYQVLNWNLDWSELSSRCESYLRSGKAVRSTEKELKYLNIDYNQFKDWPDIKEYNTGIEKGFEQYLASESEEEYTPKRRHSDEMVNPANEVPVDFMKKNSSSTECSAHQNGTMKKLKRKTFLPVLVANPDTEIKVSSSDSSFVTKLSTSTGNGNKRCKLVAQKSNYRSILLKNQRVPPISLLSEPVSFDMPQNHICKRESDIDIVSIERDAEEYSNPIILPPPAAEETVSTAGNTNPSYCIVEHDLSSPFSSPSKRDPSVLKSLRMYRVNNAKKSASDNMCIASDGEQDKLIQRFNPMLNTIDLNPRILSRSITKPKPAEVITIDIDSEPEIIDLSDDDDEASNKPQKCATKLPYDIQSKMKLNFEEVFSKNSLNKKNLFPNPRQMSDIARTLGLKSLDMIRPATTETTVQVVQLSNTSRPSVTSNSSTAPATTMILTMSQQSGAGPTAHSQVSSSNTAVIYTMAQQTTANTNLSQVPNTVPPIPTVLYAVPHQSTSHSQGRSSTSVTNETSTKPVVASRALNVSIPQTNSSSTTTSTDLSEGTSVRNFFTAAPRPLFPQSQGYSARQSPERALYNPPMRVSSPIRTSSPHDFPQTLGVIRLQHYSLLPTTESNQSLPNLSPIKTPLPKGLTSVPVSTHRYIRSGVVKTSSATSQSQTHTAVSSSRQTSVSTNMSSSTPTSSRSMQVTAHIQRVGYPPESSHSQSNTGNQMKYIFKEESSSTGEEKQLSESASDPSGNVSIVLSTEQIQQFLPKGSTHKETPTSEQDEQNSTQGASLPKFQQAFGRTMYQNSSTTGNNASLATESSQINFAQQIQASSISIDTATSASVCTVLSKAVQTTSKDSEIQSKNQSNSSNEHPHHLKTLPGSTTANAIQAVTVSTSTSQIESQLSSNLTSTVKPRTTSDRPSMLSQTPVKIFCKVPVTIANTSILQGKSLAILKTSVSPEKLSQTQVKYEVENKANETVIRSNMSALLAAALQAQPHLRTPSSSTSPSTSQGSLKSSSDVEKKKTDQPQSSTKALPPKNFRKIPVTHQPAVRYTKPVSQVTVAVSNQSTVSSSSVMTIPIRTVLTSGQKTSRLSGDRIEVRSEALGSSSAQDDSSGSSLLDQQLKEFESVFNKVKKTSQMKDRTNSNTVQHLALNHQILLTQSSSSSPNVEFTTTTTNQTTTLFQTTSTSTIHDLQGERVSLTFINQPTSATANTLIAGTSQKITSTTPVVVVQSCSNPVASPSLSVTSQSSSSPAPPSTPGSSSGKISNSAVSKQSKTNKSKTTSKAAPTTTLKLSTLPKPQQKPQEDEQTTQRIYAILDKYAEQLRNSPELKNKPAPRRRSNPPTNPSQNSKRKKSTQTKSKLPSQQASCSSSGMEMSPGSEDMRTIGSEDSSNGVSQLSQTLNSPQSRPDAPSTPTGGDVSSETSESLDSRDTRIQSRLVLTETPTGQSRTVIVQDNVPNQVLNVDASKLLSGKPVVVGSQTIVPQLVLPNVTGVQKMQLFPVPADGRPLVVTKVPKMYRVHQVTMPRGTTSLPIISSGAVVLRPMCGTPTVKQVKLPSVSSISTQSISSVIPSGTHSFTLAHDSALDSGDSININIDNAILLNSTSPQSISFVHRTIPSSSSSYQSQDSSHHGSTVTTVTSASASHKTTVPYTTSDLNVSYLKQEPGNTLSMCSSINVIPVSSPQDTKPVSCVSTSSNLTCITLDDDNEYTTTDQNSIASEVPTLVISQSNSDDNRWRSAETSMETSDAIKKEKTSQDFCSFQSTVKTMMGHRTSSASTLLMPKQERFIEVKKYPEKSMLMENSHDLQIKEEDKPERVLQEPELCGDESVSSDSAGSGRVKPRSEEKPHLLPESSQDTGSPWPYTVTKIECLVKSESPSSSVKQEETEIHSQESYKKKTNNAENTIYQMAFKRSDRNKTSNKELERNAAAIERDLRLQKSLSEDCEDLGVDEPSTSDLFPEAELLLDPDHSSRDSQLDIQSETFTQTINSSSSCDSREMSPMTSLGKRPAFYRSGVKSQSVSSKTNRFVPSFNPIYQFPEESTSAPVPSTRLDSPECQIIGFNVKGNKLGSNSDSSSPCTTKSLCNKDSQSPTVMTPQKLGAHDQAKSSSSGASTPINGGESRVSPNCEEMPNNFTSEESQCTQKTNEDSKTVEIDTSDSDSIIETINLVSSDDTTPDRSFVPIPNPAATSPFTYAGNRGSKKNASRKIQEKRELWKNVLKDSKEDLDSDMSDQDQVRVSDKRSTSTDEDLQSEGESRAKNGLGRENEDIDPSSAKVVSSLKNSKKRSASLPKCSSSKSKVQRRTEPQHIDHLLIELPNSTETCQNAERHHDTFNRRSSLRGHIKKNCPCCNGSQEKPKSHVKTSQKPDKVLSVPCPSSSLLVISSSKKKQNRSVVKSSHITKKR